MVTDKVGAATRIHIRPGKPTLELLERLSDSLLSADQNPKELLATGVGFFLQLLGAESGAVYVQPDPLRPPYMVVEHNLPAEFSAFLRSPEFNFDLIRQSMLGPGRFHVFSLANQNCVGIPLLSPEGIEGLALILRAPFSADESDTAWLITRHFSRDLLLHRQIHRPAQNPRDLQALDIITEAQSTHFQIGRMQEVILGGIKALLRAEIIDLTLIEDDTLVTKRFLGDNQQWLFEETLTLRPSVLQKSIQTGETIVINEVRLAEDFNADIDASKRLNVVSLITTPILANGTTLGAIEVINFQTGPIRSSEINLIASMATSLANSIISLRLIEQLKIANADLEASRWELLNSRNTLRTLFDSLPSSIYIVDHSYTIVALNISRSNRAGENPSRLVGKTCYQALYNLSAPCPGCKVGETLRTGKSHTRTNREWKEDADQPIEWEISAYAIRDTAGAPYQAILIEEDVTDRRRLEANLIQNEKLAAVGQLAAGVAHEINNPLAAIIANAQIIDRFLPPNDDLRESARLIELAGVRASQVVKNLLGFARKERFEFALIDLNQTIHDALSLVQHEVLARSVTIQLSLDEDIPSVLASRDHLQGVWVNMIVNAIDALDKEKKEIKISSRYKDGDFVVLFADNGKGIPPEKLPRIFEPFYTTKSPERGTGLGLSVCYRVIKQHGGQIEVDSQEHVGTNFKIIIPGRREQ